MQACISTMWMHRDVSSGRDSLSDCRLHHKSNIMLRVKRVGIITNSRLCRVVKQHVLHNSISPALLSILQPPTHSHSRGLKSASNWRWGLLDAKSRSPRNCCLHLACLHHCGARCSSRIFFLKMFSLDDALPVLSLVCSPFVYCAYGPN